MTKDGQKTVVLSLGSGDLRASMGKTHGEMKVHGGQRERGYG